MWGGGITACREVLAQLRRLYRAVFSRLLQSPRYRIPEPIRPRRMSKKGYDPSLRSAFGAGLLRHRRLLPGTSLVLPVEQRPYHWPV